jgi:hypothetical protein
MLRYNAPTSRMNVATVTACAGATATVNTAAVPRAIADGEPWVATLRAARVTEVVL